MKAYTIKAMTVSGLAAALAIFALVVLGCSSGSQSSSASASGSSASGSASSSAVVGGWTVPTDVETIIKADEKAIYDSASGAEASEQLVALLATQVVSGMNYAFLGKDDAGWNVIVCYKSADGKTQVTSKKAIDPANLKTIESEGDAGQSKDVVGGWTVQVPESPATLPDDAQAAFTKALEGYTGAGLNPIALLGTQVVSGMNYLVLCEGAPVVQDPKPELYAVVVYQDLQGNAQLASVEVLDFLYYIGN